MYLVWQALNNQYVRDEMKKINLKAIRFEIFHIKWKQFNNYTYITVASLGIITTASVLKLVVINTENVGDQSLNLLEILLVKKTNQFLHF